VQQPEILVAPATLADVAAIAALNRQLDTEHFSYSVEHRIREAIDRGEYYVARVSGDVVGAISLCREDGAFKIVTIASRETGAGRALVRRAEARCREEKVAKLFCWSLVRYGVVDFYRQLGFTEVHCLQQQWFGEDCFFCGKVIE